jgi:hypothetical protein
MIVIQKGMSVSICEQAVDYDHQIEKWKISKELIRHKIGKIKESAFNPESRFDSIQEQRRNVPIT